VSPASLSFTPGNWGQPQTVTATGVDDDVADGSQETLVSITVDAAASDDAFDALAPGTVMVTTVDDDESGFTLTTGAAVSISEGGGTALLSVVLDTRPGSLVRLTFVSQDPLVATVAPTALMFTPSAWSTSQSVTVSAVNDDLVGGDRLTSVLVAIDDSASDDGFDGVANQTVQVTVVDDDSAGITLADTTGLIVTESGATDAFTVALAAEPASSVVLSVSSGDMGEVTVSPMSLTFTSANWNAPQAVTLSGVDDLVADGDRQTEITITVVDAQSDVAFAGMSAAAQATTMDDDAAGITVSASALTVAEGGTAVFTVRLDSEPTEDVVVDVRSLDESEVAVTPASLTFTPSDWSVPQDVTVTGGTDATVGDEQTQVVIAVDPPSSDPAYAGVPSREVTVTTTDDDDDPDGGAA
jgi:hypothetical protein